MKPMPLEAQNEIECAIDEYGIEEVLYAMKRICDDKAYYIESIELNFDAIDTAQWWRQRAIALYKLAIQPFMRDAT